MTNSILIKKSGLSIFLWLCCYLCYAQTPPVFVPNDFDFETEEIGCICNPGVINNRPEKDCC